MIYLTTRIIHFTKFLRLMLLKKGVQSTLHVSERNLLNIIFIVCEVETALTDL